MFDISNADEARNILEKEALSTEDTRRVLLYLVQRDEETRNAFQRVQALLVALFQTVHPLLLIFQKLPFVGLAVDSDFKSKLNESVKSLEKASALVSQVSEQGNINP